MRNRDNLSTSRREMIIGAAVAVGGTVLFPWRSFAAEAAEEISHTAESIHQRVRFAVHRERVFAVLTDRKRFHEIELRSGAMKSGMALGSKPTKISREAGGVFTIFGGHIMGRHIELVPNVRIVQAWRVVNWDPGVYSIAKFEFLEQDGGSEIVLDHTGFPPGQAQHLADGWKANYWEPLQKLLAQPPA